MRTIQVLDKQTIDKIAAGEVVDRPASVIKELTENAIDAAATAITIEIKDGGTTFMRITDNGGGIPREQVQTAFLRHATSKIRKVEDLTEIASLGFRGEALSSIAAVSQMECITKTPDALTGTRYVIEGGVEKEYEEIGAPSGTTFIVRNLFFNVPARAKFLKSPVTEGNHVSNYVEELALSHPEISFKFIQNGQNRLYTSGNGNLKEIAYQIFGRDLTRELIAVDHQTDFMHLRGFIGNPNVARGNRNFENYFVNGRYVKSKIIAKAIEDAYHGFLMQHKYPFTLLYLEIDGKKVDVNVHPQKLEVRLSNEEDIYHTICLAIQNALMNRERIPQVPVGKEKTRSAESQGKLPVIRQSVPEPFEKVRRHNEAEIMPTEIPIPEIPDVFRKPATPAGPATTWSRPSAPSSAGSSYQRPSVAATASSYQKDPETTRLPFRSKPQAETAGEKPVRNTAPSGNLAPSEKTVSSENPTPSEKTVPSAKPEQMNLFDQDKVLSEQARKMFRIIGQIFETYWLIEYKDSLYIIDQHAAHEKVNYERMMKNYKEKKINAQMLYPAIVVSLSKKEADLLERNMEVFTKLGYDIEPFGGTTFKINAVPDNLYSIASDRLFTEILDDLGELGEIDPKIIPEKLASMSCKAAVKGNNKMSLAEANALIDELLGLENPYNCPHGRPTIVSMTKYELDKKFKRIV